MSILSNIYGGAVAARNAMYDRGLLKSQRLKWPVVSVGNIRVGGTGKTPFTIALGKLLQKHGVAFDVLSRGYGRSSSGVKLVEERGTAAEFGDEPLLIAQKLEVPVIVGGSRYQAGLFAERMFANATPSHGLWLHLLDDGFQHRQLARDFDIVLVKPEDVDEALLPSGRLREPLAALERANAVVLMNNVQLDPCYLVDKHVWRAQSVMVLSDELREERLVAFCGVAQPHQFFLGLEAVNIVPVANLSFPDHHRYSQSDIDRLLDLMRRNRADAFITTEKDLQNLTPYLSQLSRLHAVPLVMNIYDADTIIDPIVTTVSQRLRQRAGS